MCIIAIKQKGVKMFSKTLIRNMFENNPDGAGFMYYDKSKNKVVVKKGIMDVEELISELYSKDFTNTSLVLHCRIASVGNVNELNTHPFPIYEDNKLEFETDIAFCHNGTLFNYRPNKYNAGLSDTMMFGKYVLAQLSKGFQNDKNTMFLLNEIIENSKLAFIDNTGKISTLGNYVKSGNYYFSNNSFSSNYYDFYNNYKLSLK